MEKIEARQGQAIKVTMPKCKYSILNVHLFFLILLRD